MSDQAEQRNEAGLRLADAIREARNAAADREDVVVDLREAQKTRLELLADQLSSTFSEVPADAGFDFAISQGTQPRLWIDAVSYVTMGRDRRTYRFIKDSRAGRIVLKESLDVTAVADQVVRYVADRLVERERLMEGDVESVLSGPLSHFEERESRRRDRARRERWKAVLSGILLFFAGAAVGLVGASIVLWDRLKELGIGF